MKQIKLSGRDGEVQIHKWEKDDKRRAYINIYHNRRSLSVGYINLATGEYVCTLSQQQGVGMSQRAWRVLSENNIDEAGVLARMN